MVDRSKLLFFSEDPLDKIVYTATGTISIDDTNNATESDTVTHNLGRLTLPVLYWTPDGTNFYSDEQLRVDTFSPSSTIASGVWAESDTDETIVYFFKSFDGPVQETITYYLSLIELET